MVFPWDFCDDFKRPVLRSYFNSVSGSQSIHLGHRIWVYFTSVIASQSHSRYNLGFTKGVSFMVRYGDFSHSITKNVCGLFRTKKYVFYSVLSQ